MRAIQYTLTSSAPDNVECAEVPDVESPGEGEVVVAIEAFPINPSDLLLLTGQYADQMTAVLKNNAPTSDVTARLANSVGGEATGRVLAIGSGVTDLATGQTVIMLARGVWRERLRIRADLVIPVDEDIDVFQRAMLKNNPGTAWFLLNGEVSLKPGDWLIHTAANSAVGRIIASLARAQGLRVVNIVRRREAVGACRRVGDELVLVDGPDLMQRVREVTGGAPIRLALDPVGGELARRMVNCLADGGRYISYGFLGGSSIGLDISDLIFRRITVTGLSSVHALSRDHRDNLAIYDRLGALTKAGTIRSQVAAAYEMEDISRAVAHAMRGDTAGKILVRTR